VHHAAPIRAILCSECPTASLPSGELPVHRSMRDHRHCRPAPSNSACEWNQQLTWEGVQRGCPDYGVFAMALAMGPWDAPPYLPGCSRSAVPDERVGSQGVRRDVKHASEAATNLPRQLLGDSGCGRREQTPKARSALTRGERRANQAKQPDVFVSTVRDRLQQAVVIPARRDCEDATHRLDAVAVSIALMNSEAVRTRSETWCFDFGIAPPQKPGASVCPPNPGNSSSRHLAQVSSNSCTSLRGAPRRVFGAMIGGMSQWEDRRPSQTAEDQPEVGCLGLTVPNNTGDAEQHAPGQSSIRKPTALRPLTISG
jgi:hypothetical protein